MAPLPDHTVMHLLLVEDNPGDVDLIREALEGAPVRTSVAADGVAALERLRSAEDLPNLVLLDLNLPRKDGRAVLREMKADPRLRRIPVIILSSSDADRDLREAYDLHANCFVKKPSEVDEFYAAVRGIESFWAHLVKMPSQDA